MFGLTGSRVHSTGLKVGTRFTHTGFNTNRELVRRLWRGFLLAIPLLTVLGGATHALAGTVVSGNAGGVWDLPGSPYWVEGDLVIPSDSTLVIEPGVEVRFRGPYRFLVNGALHASGTAQDSIVFTWDSPVPEDQWRGLRFVGSDNTCILEYCRIEHARSAAQFPDVRGAGVYCYVCSLTVRHCLIQYNVSHNSNYNGTGGGVVSVNAWPLIEHCTIRDNQADSGGGIAFLEDQSDTSGCPIVRNSFISDNIAPYCGGGIYVGAFSTPVIENNIISGNLAGGFGGGGIALWTTNGIHLRTVNNNIISGNSTSTDGGGIYIRYDSSVLVNNTIVGNSADSTGGGVYVLNFGGDTPQLLNTTIWGNSASRDSSVSVLDVSTEVEITYSDVEGGWPGTGNIDQDPLFADMLFHLSAGSPCIDAGDPDAIYNDQCFPPSQGTVRNDMGAYGGPLGCVWPETCADAGGRLPDEIPSQIGLHVGNTPNPFSSATEIRFDLPKSGVVDLAVYDVRGRQVRRLLAGAVLAAGTHSAVWDGRSDSGLEAAPGVYLCRIRVAGAEGLGKMLLLE
jgi:parallel beta-helix repeat protein